MSLAQQRDQIRAEFIARQLAIVNAPLPEGALDMIADDQEWDDLAPEIEARYNANLSALLAVRMISEFGFEPEEIEGRFTTDDSKTTDADDRLVFLAILTLDDGRKFDGWSIHGKPFEMDAELYYYGPRYTGYDPEYITSADDAPELAAYRDSQGWRDPAEAIARALPYYETEAGDPAGFDLVNTQARDLSAACGLFVEAVAARWAFPLNRVRFNSEACDYRDDTGKRLPSGKGDILLVFEIASIKEPVGLVLYAWANRSDGFQPFGFELVPHLGEDGPPIAESEFPDAAALRNVLATIADRFPAEEATSPTA